MEAISCRPSVATLTRSGAEPEAIWVSTLARKSFQSVPLMPVTSSFMALSSFVTWGWSFCCRAVAALCCPK